MVPATQNTTSSAASGEAVISIENLTVCYGTKRAVDDLSLSVPAGSIFGFLGPNGAGKTSTIKALLGFRRADAGTMQVFGRDSVHESLGIRSRIGYVSESNSLYEDMTIAQLCHFCQQTSRSWNQAIVERYIRLFGLPSAIKVKQLSKGMKPQLALSLAMGGDPDLLILDEPTSGLDPIARRAFLNALVSDVAAAGKTVFFSSHILSEVEAIADHVAIIHKGRLAISDDLDQLKQSHAIFKLSFDSQPTMAALAKIGDYPGVIQVQQEGRFVRMYRRGAGEDFIAELGRDLPMVRHIEMLSMGLEDLFLAYAKDQLDAC